MSYWYRSKPRLASLTPTPPGLWELLTRRTWVVSPASTVLHIGMVVSLITGILLELMFLTGLAGLFQGWGWTVTWAHALCGLAATLGFAGVLVRFSKSPHFRMAADRVFYIDTAFLAVIGISGIVLFLQLVGLMSPGSGLATMLHMVSAIAWLVASIFMDGLVAHGLATVAYRLNLRGKRDAAAFKAFGSACGRCGKCIEICPQFEASGGQPVEAPALKVRQGLNRLRQGGSQAELKHLAEEMYACTLCGLCVGVCPYSFRHYDLYTTLLAQVNRSAEGGAARS